MCRPALQVNKQALKGDSPVIYPKSNLVTLAFNSKTALNIFSIMKNVKIKKKKIRLELKKLSRQKTVKKLKEG